MTKQDAIAVRFQDGSVVAIENVFAHCDAYNGERGYLSPHYVVWSDGFESYAKGWWLEGQLCRVGAGTSGDLVVLDRQLELWEKRAVSGKR